MHVHIVPLLAFLHMYVCLYVCNQSNQIKSNQIKSNQFQNDSLLVIKIDALCIMKLGTSKNRFMQAHLQSIGKYITSDPLYSERGHVKFRSLMTV